MINFKITIDEKLGRIDRFGEPIVDFISRDIAKDSNIGVRIIDYYTVSAEDSMRIDQISLHMYGTQNDAEIILKYNGISNPFSIDEGDILFVYEPISARKKMSNLQNDGIKEDIRNQYINPDKLSIVDKTLGDFTDRPDIAELQRNAKLPPNFAKFGDLEIKVEGGKLIFGDDVSKNRIDCDKPLSKSEFLARIIKNRI